MTRREERVLAIEKIVNSHPDTHVLNVRVCKSDIFDAASRKLNPYGYSLIHPYIALGLLSQILDTEKVYRMIEIERRAY